MRRDERQLYKIAKRYATRLGHELCFWRDRKNFISISGHEEIEITLETTVSEMERFVKAIAAFEKHHGID